MPARVHEAEVAETGFPPHGKSSEPHSAGPADRSSRTGTPAYFVLTILGFSFWFFMAVPFASHRESYTWLAWTHTQTVAQQFSFGLSSTYRPLAELVTWLSFRVLASGGFPTSVVRQTCFQIFIYTMFVLAWWLIYSAAPQRRLFALCSFVAGGVFFSGYVHLFHIYGLMYVPVVLMLGALLHFQAKKSFQESELWFGAIAIALVFWHPFATALFVGFYSGFYLETFKQRSKAQRVQAIAILSMVVAALGASVVFFPREHMSLGSKLFGVLFSYKTNEINGLASLVACIFALLVVGSMALPSKAKLAAFLGVSALGAALFLASWPVLFLWIGAVVTKLIRTRSWSLLFLALTASALPFGGGIGTPMYAFFAIVVAVYVTPLGWSQAEGALSFFKPQYVVALTLVMASAIVMVRLGINVPVVTRFATPLLAERERTYQLENVLAWLHNSDHCEDQIAFAQNAGSPVDSVDNIITRRDRPPAALGDVRLFWNTALQCQIAQPHNGPTGTAVITFGGPTLPGAKPIYQVTGKYGGNATVWITDSRKF